MSTCKQMELECWHRTAGEYTVFDDTAFSFSVPALVPSKQCPLRERWLADGRNFCCARYTINCDGWKRSKPWVPVVCSNFPEACPDISLLALLHRAIFLPEL